MNRPIITASICLFKNNKRNSGTRCEIYSKLTIKTSEWRRDFIQNVSFENDLAVKEQKLNYLNKHELVFSLFLNITSYIFSYEINELMSLKANKKNGIIKHNSFLHCIYFIFVSLRDNYKQ